MFDSYKAEHEKILQDRLIRRAEQYLDLKRWMFKLNYKSYSNGYVAIYDSSFCRLRCSLSLDPRDKDDTIGISYGRSHAPDENNYIVYQGKNCQVWHDFLMGYVGQFLDGITPHKLARARIEHISIPSRARKAFEENAMGKELRSPVWGLRLEEFAWEYYGNDLFELFDIRRSEKWEEYRHFLIELYNELIKNPNEKKILDERPQWKPFPWQVC